MSDTNMLSPQLEAPAENETKERSWDEQGAQRLERQLFFALLGFAVLSFDMRCIAVLCLAMLGDA